MVWGTSLNSGCIDNLNLLPSVKRRSDNEQNHLAIAEVKLPSNDSLVDAGKYEDEKGGKLVIPNMLSVFLKE